MTFIAKFLSVLALSLTLLAPFLFALGKLGEASMKGALVVGAIMWFAAAPRWFQSTD